MYKTPLAAFLLFILNFPAFADQASIERGKKIYDQVCFACHGKNLEGATGFNLKDSEWVHGSTPEEILASVKKGFPDKGMIAFETVYKESQLKDVVHYILSKQEGLRELKYEIFQGITPKTEMKDIKWNSLKPDKTGTVKPSYVNFNIPEVDNFAMRFKGKLIIPEGGKYSLSGRLRQNNHFEVLINGKPLNLKIRRKRFKINLKLQRGTHLFEARLVKDDKYCNMQLKLEKNKFVIPLSMSSFRKIKNQKVIVKAVKNPLVIRKKINDLPSKTIAVTYPQNVNYAFNPANGSVNGFWLG